MVDKEIVKAIKFGYENSEEKLKDLLLKFRDLANYCIKVGLEKNITSKYKLIKEIGYSKAKEFNLHTHYVISACEIACSPGGSYTYSIDLLNVKYYNLSSVVVNNIRGGGEVHITRFDNLVFDLELPPGITILT